MSSRRGVRSTAGERSGWMASSGFMIVAERDVVSIPAEPAFTRLSPRLEGESAFA